MTLYHLQCSVFIKPPNDANINSQIVPLLKKWAVTINPGQPNEQHSQIIVDFCTHEDPHAAPCPEILHWQSP